MAGVEKVNREEQKIQNLAEMVDIGGKISGPNNFSNSSTLAYTRLIYKKNAIQLIPDTALTHIQL